MGNGVKYFAIGVALLAISALLGIGLAQVSQPPMDVVQVDEPTTSAKERFELGQNAYEPPKVKARRSFGPDHHDSNYEVGKMKNGKRLLVPGEPALRKQRDALEAEEKAIADYFGENEESPTEAAASYQDSMNPDQEVRPAP